MDRRARRWYNPAMNEAPRDQRLSLVALALAILVNLVAIDLPLMGGDDATLFASIAATMAKRGDFVGLYAWGEDWLDKPHLPFWLTAVSFRLFGIAGWSYRLPAFFAIVGAAYYTFRLATRFYGRTVGVWAAIILLTAEHTILTSADVRAEPYVAFFVIASTWYLIRVAEDARWRIASIAGGLFAAAAMMTKGPFTLVPVVGALGGHWLLRGRPAIAWRRWAMVVLVAAIGIAPELGALNAQFDRHPEKIVFGRTGVSGIRFFLWDSQFGRFLGTGPIHRGGGSLTFFAHTLLWVFLPWSFGLVLALVRRARLLWARHLAPTEWYSLSGATLMFVVFSVSQFQLPHYLNIIFPFLAILTAAEIQARASTAGFRLLARVQVGLLVIMVSAGVTIGLLTRPDGGVAVPFLAMALVAAIPVVWRMAADNGVRLVTASVLAAAAVNLYLERGIYPTLLRYDGGPVAARYVNERYPDAAVVVARDHQLRGFDFGLQRPPQYIRGLEDTSGVAARPYLLLMAVDGKEPPDPRTVHSFDNFSVSRPTIRFLNRKTRAGALSRLDLVLIAGPSPAPAPTSLPHP